MKFGGTLGLSQIGEHQLKVMETVEALNIYHIETSYYPASKVMVNAKDSE